MPANSVDGAIARQWEILKIIPSARSPGLKSSDFKNELGERGYEVSLRTVQRDLEALAKVFDIDCIFEIAKKKKDGKPGKKKQDCIPDKEKETEEQKKKNEKKRINIQWRWQSGAKLDIQSLELTDALTLRLIATSLRPLLPASVLKALEPRLKSAAEKLDAVNSSNSVSGWANKVASVLPMVPFIPPKIDPNVLETVQDCLLKDFVITCRYRSVAAEKPKELTLHPLGLVQRGPVTYLIATAFHYEEPRPFALHRMSAVVNTYDSVKRPKGFSLKQFIDDGGMGFGEATPINLVARISPMLARELEETKLSAHQKIRPDGDWFRIEATVQDTWQLRWWLLGKSGEIVIVEPDVLRKDLLGFLNRAINDYQEKNV